jgi:hypothetical protein
MHCAHRVFYHLNTYILKWESNNFYNFEAKMGNVPTPKQSTRPVPTSAQPAPTVDQPSGGEAHGGAADKM